MTATAFELPAIEDAEETVELTAWLVEVGQTVSEGQPIAEVETEKSVVEIDSPYNGTIEELLVDEWAEVAIGQEIATFEVDEAAVESADDAADADESATEETEDADSDQPAEIETPAGRVFAPPRVRRLARELGVDITAVEGSDESGRITEADVREEAEDESDEGDDSGPKPFTPSGKSAVSKSGESVSGAGLSEKGDSKSGSGPKPFTPSGKAAVSKSGGDVSSAGAAGDHVADEAAAERAYYDTATVDRLVDLTSTLQSDAEAHGIELGPLPIVIKAVSRAIADAEISVDSHIGVGIRTDDGLTVPVVRDVDDKTLRSVAEEITDLVDDGADPAETKTPAAVVTEPAALGDGHATPPLGGASVAVGLGALEPRPVVEDGAVVARETLPVSLAVDGDAVEPTDGAAVMNRLVAFLEEPSRLLLDSK